MNDLEECEIPKSYQGTGNLLEILSIDHDIRLYNY